MSEAAQLQDEKEPPPPIRIYNELSEDQTEVTPHVNHFDHPIRPSSFSVWPPREIGKGRFSKVFQTKLGDADVVLKVCEKLPWADVETSDLDKELDILSHIGRHPNLIYPVAVCEHLVDAGLTENTCYDIGPVFPLKAGGNLEDFVQRHPEVIDDPVSLRNILLGVCRGVQALHKQQIVHRDIACRNFLVDQSGRIVLSDFGLSRRLIEVHLSFLWLQTSSTSTMSQLRLVTENSQSNRRVRRIFSVRPNFVRGSSTKYDASPPCRPSSATATDTHSGAEVLGLIEGSAHSCQPDVAAAAVAILRIFEEAQV